MKSVNVAELKNRLSHYLREVRRGRPVLVRDRDTVIARIEPAGPGTVRDGATSAPDAERLAALESRGVLRRASGRISAELLARRPRARVDVVAAVIAERDEGR